MKIIFLLLVCLLPFGLTQAFQEEATVLLTEYLTTVAEGKPGQAGLRFLCHPDEAAGADSISGPLLAWGVYKVELLPDQRYALGYAVVWTRDNSNTDELPRWYYEVFLNRVDEETLCIEHVLPMLHSPE